MTEFQKSCKLHSKKLPCLTCIIRVPCGNIKGDRVRDPCDKYDSWHRVRDVLVGKDMRRGEIWNEILKQELKPEA